MHKNNFDSLRFLFASFVIITHGFGLSGHGNEDLIYKLSNGQLNFAYLGLRGFFIISGFLIYQSYERSKSMGDFIWKRILRIFPGLLVVSFITAFIIGPLITTLSFENYFSNNEPWLFFTHAVNLIFHSSHKCLPGVFTNNPFGCEVNGSLWTITYEFIFYFCLLLLFIFPTKKTGKIFLLITFVIIYLFKFYYLEYRSNDIYIWKTSISLIAVYDFGRFFILGSIFASFYFNKLPLLYNKIILIISSLVFILVVYMNWFTSVPEIIVPCILSLGLLKFKFFPFLEKTGDISYGIYLYGFPIQQIIVQYFHIGPYVLISTSLIIAYIVGFLSWQLVEKPSLKLKSFWKNKLIHYSQFIKI